MMYYSEAKIGAYLLHQGIAVVVAKKIVRTHTHTHTQTCLYVLINVT